MLKKYFSKFVAPKNTKSSSYFDLSEITTALDNKPSASPQSYRNNVIVYRCVNLIAQSASHVPWTVHIKNGNRLNKLDQHPLHELLIQLNQTTAGADFFTEVISSLLLFGNSYILGLGSAINSFPKSMYVLPSSQTDIIVENGAMRSYRYRNAKGEHIYPINQITSKSNVLHLKNYHSSNQIYGLSCLEAASMPIEIHNQASRWNYSLLKNGARPSGALVMKDSAGYLSDEQFERLKQQLYDKYTGASNSGKPLLLEGGLDWREMSISPKDMDFIESKNSAAREIALAFGVPPQLLGINGDNTYSNMQEARLGLWEETIIPLMDKIANALTHWLSGYSDEKIIIDFDRDAISALTGKRENLWSKISNCNFMTMNEKRSFVGLKPLKGGDELL
ncbi:MAG: phage portal protein [Rickettsiaceae bacterium]|nr:phage portal protein [Rickettsiaceae bacterium]